MERWARFYEHDSSNQLYSLDRIDDNCRSRPASGRLLVALWGNNLPFNKKKVKERIVLREIHL